MLNAPNQSQSQSVLEPFLEKEYRDAYLESFVKGGVAYQIHSLREKSGLNQREFGEVIGKPQSVVSRLESTEYGSVNVTTLLSIAKALNVALEIRFTDYPTSLATDVTPAAFAVDSIFESYEKSHLLALSASIEALPSASETVAGPSTLPLFFILYALTAGLSKIGELTWTIAQQNRQLLSRFSGPATLNSVSYTQMQPKTS